MRQENNQENLFLKGAQTPDPDPIFDCGRGTVQTVAKIDTETCTVFGCLDITKKCENVCMKNGASTEVPLKPAFYRYCVSPEASL